MPGESVVVKGVGFSPGELAALVDYVGDLTTLEFYSRWQLVEMKILPGDECEDAATWDRVTGGRYSELAFDNEGHFAPGVSSEAHPASWVLTGDHPERNPETMAALTGALTECRDMVELMAMPGMDPTDVARRLFDRHRPMPTEDGQKTVDEALTAATRGGLALAQALSDAACEQIQAVMDEALDAQVVVEMNRPSEQPDDRASIGTPSGEPSVELPDTRRSYVPGL